jgi:hypothetical protein
VRGRSTVIGRAGLVDFQDKDSPPLDLEGTADSLNQLGLESVRLLQNQ